jgi:uncharacterized protein YjiS (DUF1127 family)
MKITKIVKWLASVNQTHKDRVALSRMEDNLLKDIGLTRGDICNRVKYPKFGEINE